MTRDIVVGALRVVVVVALVALAIADFATAWLAVAWLDLRQVPLWAWAFWLLRGAVLAGTVRVAADPRRPLRRLLTVAGLLLVFPTVSPLGALDSEDSARLTLGVCALAAAAVGAWRAHRSHAA